VHAALRAISGFETAAGEPLVLGIVSDFLMPEPPVTEQKIQALERQFVEVLRSARLNEFFEPPGERITLSSRAGVNKPDRRIFELATQRSRTGAALNACLFVTENQDHLNACRGLGMAVLRFGPGDSNTPSFTDWSEAPLLIGNVVAPAGPNLEAALRVRLAATDRLELTHTAPTTTDETVRGRAKAWVPLDDHSLGDLRGVHVQLPVDVEVRLDPHGRVANVSVGAPDPDARTEAVAHTQSLISSGQVDVGAGTSPTIATHQVEVDARGQRFLKRKRFTAW
jgi:hypothetical protein